MSDADIKSRDEVTILQIFCDAIARFSVVISRRARNASLRSSCMALVIEMISQ